MSNSKIKKYYDIGPAAIASTGVYTGGATGWATGIADANGPFIAGNAWLTAVSQSDDDQGRVGQSINIETLDVRVKVIPDNTLVGHGHLRVIIFSDEELDGAYPTLAELLANSTVATGGVMSFLQPGYFGRFKVIEDKHFQWYNSSTANSFQDNEARELWHESHHDMRGHRAMWDQTNNSAIANARKGHIFIAFIYESTTVAAGGIITQATTNPPGVQFTTRIRFVDT